MYQKIDQIKSAYLIGFFFSFKIMFYSFVFSLYILPIEKEKSQCYANR